MHWFSCGQELLDGELLQRRKSMHQSILLGGLGSRVWERREGENGDRIAWEIL